LVVQKGGKRCGGVLCLLWYSVFFGNAIPEQKLPFLLLWDTVVLLASFGSLLMAFHVSFLGGHGERWKALLSSFLLLRFPPL